MPLLIKRFQNKPRIIEGALQFTISPQGKITRIVNRKITEEDRRNAEEFRELKASQHAQFDQEDRKAAEKELRDKIERKEI